MRNKIAVVLLALILVAVRGVHAQNSVIAQLGAGGVTEKGGDAAYAHYIPRLDATGKLSAVMLPDSIGGGAASTVPLSSVAFIDPIMGIDTVGTGAISAPYRTVNYAFTSFGDAYTSTDTLYVLLPGTHANITIPAFLAARGPITLVGFGASNTRVARVTFAAGAPSAHRRLSLHGITVTERITDSGMGKISITVIGDTTIGLVEVAAANTKATLTQGPGTTVTSLSGTFTRVFTHSSDITGYTPLPTEEWSTPAPGTVTEAIRAILNITSEQGENIDHVDTKINITSNSLFEELNKKVNTDAVMWMRIEIPLNPGGYPGNWTDYELKISMVDDSNEPYNMVYYYQSMGDPWENPPEGWGDKTARVYYIDDHKEGDIRQWQLYTPSNPTPEGTYSIAGTLNNPLLSQVESVIHFPSRVGFLEWQSYTNAGKLRATYTRFDGDTTETNRSGRQRWHPVNIDWVPERMSE